MDYIFTDEDKENKLNFIELEDMVFYGDTLSGAGKNYVLAGTALIDGEKYPTFEIEFELTELPASQTLEDIMSVEGNGMNLFFKTMEFQT